MTIVEINVRAGKDQVFKPWIWQLSRDFNAKLVLKKASVDADFGLYLIELSGSVEEIQRATAWLMTTGMHVEALSRAVGA